MSDLVDIRTALTDWLAKVDTSPAITEQEMGEIQKSLDGIWKAADGNAEIESLALEVWQRAQSLAEQTNAATFQMAAISSIAHNAIEQAEAEAKALDDLETAIESQDEDHPRLRDWAEAIRDSAQMDFEELVLDGVYPEAMAEAYDEIREEEMLKIENLTGCGWRAADMFLAVIMGRRIGLTALQLAMFKEFMETFVARLEAGEWTNGRP